MMESISVTVLGYGRLGRVLSTALHNQGLLHQIYNRPGKLLPSYPEISVIHNIEDLQDADVYLLTVSDDAIRPISSKLLDLIPSSSVVAHCSGMRRLDVLNLHPCRGCLYPLQTFGNKALNLADVPCYLSADDEETLHTLHALGSKLFGSVDVITDEQKEWLHIAAVFANNFANHMLHVCHEICASKDLNFAHLLPLIKQTLTNVEEVSPGEVQTGPAIRGDTQTVQQHVSKLNGMDKWADMYTLISRSINPNLDL